MELKDSVIKELEFLTGRQDSRIVCWFSHGIASTIATKLTIMANNKMKQPKKVVVADIYLEEEHKDNIRFYKEVKEWLLEDLSDVEKSRVEFTTLMNEKYQGSVDNVINSSRYMSGIYGAMCTSVLKKEVRYNWQQPNDVHVFGMTVEEQNRIDRLLDGEADILVFAPLIEQGLTKMDCFDWFSSSNIKPPIMYELGFNNNNCFHGDEQFITDEGFKTFKDVVGESFNVVTRGGWKKGVVKHFGKQELMKLTLSRGANTKDVLVTPNHRWVLDNYKEVNTKQLIVGDLIPFIDEDTLSITKGGWVVENIKVEGLVEDVYCLQVEGEYKEFTLKGGILTGNCKGCFHLRRKHNII